MANKKMVTYAASIALINDRIEEIAPSVQISNLNIQSMASNKLITYAKAKDLIDDMIEEIPPIIPSTNGIYIVDQDGKFYSTSKWNTANNSKASGVAVIDASASFIIAPTYQAKDDLIWGLYGTLIPGCHTGWGEARDYAGEANTTAIINTLGAYGTAAIAALMYIEEDITAANNEAAAIPQTLSLEDDLDNINVFDAEEYSTLLDKQAEGTLSEEESARLSELNSLRIKQEFMKKYNIANDTVLYILLEKIRQRLKTNIDITQSDLPEKYVDTKDVDNLSHDGIMVMMLENDNSQVEEKPIVYGSLNIGCDYAANRCRNYIFKHGKAGFLAACGQWYVIIRLKSAINAALRLIGGEELLEKMHWSSSQYDAEKAFGVSLYYDYDYTNTKDTREYVRAICSI